MAYVFSKLPLWIRVHINSFQQFSYIYNYSDRMKEVHKKIEQIKFKFKPELARILKDADENWFAYINNNEIFYELVDCKVLKWYINKYDVIFEYGVIFEFEPSCHGNRYEWYDEDQEQYYSSEWG